MFFKNAKFYRLTKDIDLTNIDEQLEAYAFRNCGQQEVSTHGFDHVIGGSFSLQSGGMYTVRLTKEERMLPAMVVNRELATRVKEIEESTGAPVGKKAQADLKQDIIQQLLPQAFTDITYTFASIMPAKRLVVIDSPTDGKAEAMLALIRKALGSLPVAPLARRGLQQDLTDWLKATPSKVMLLEQVKLISDSEEKGELKTKNMSLDSEEITVALESHKYVAELAIEFDEAFDCILCEDGSIKRIKFSDGVKEQNADIPKDEYAAKVDADLFLNNSILASFAEMLSEEFELDTEE